MGDAEMAVDAGESLLLHRRMPRLGPLGLLVRVEGVVVVAVAALERIGLLHARPDARGELVAARLEFFLRVDHADEVAPELEARAHLSLDERPRLMRHVAVGA